MSLRMAGRLARRELRGGLSGFRIFLACLALGVAAIAAVGSVRQAIQAGLAQEGASLLGAMPNLNSPIVLPMRQSALDATDIRPDVRGCRFPLDGRCARRDRSGTSADSG